MSNYNPLYIKPNSQSTPSTNGTQHAAIMIDEKTDAAPQEQYRWWNSFRQKILSVLDHRVIAKLVIKLDADAAVAMLQKPIPPGWFKEWMASVPQEVFPQAKGGFLAIVFFYLEWRHSQSPADRKYKLYATERGFRMEMRRLHNIASARCKQQQEVSIIASRIILTGIEHLWAGIPHEDWLVGKKLVPLDDEPSGENGTTAMTQSEAEWLWEQVIQLVNGVTVTDKRVLQAVRTVGYDRIRNTQPHNIHFIKKELWEAYK